MSVPDPKAGVALTGLVRTWKQVLMLPWKQVEPSEFWAPLNERVATAFPDGLWMCVIQGMRSDDVPFSVTAPIDGRMFKDPMRLGNHVAGAWQVLHTYLGCGCVEGTMCDEHRRLSGASTVSPIEAPQVRPN